MKQVRKQMQTGAYCREKARVNARMSRCWETLEDFSDEEKVVMLRMNQGFIEMMRREYPQALTLKYPKFGTIVSPQDNVEDPQPSDKAPLRFG